MIPESIILQLSEALGIIFLILFRRRQAWNLMDFKGSRIQSKRGCAAKSAELWALKEFQAAIADLQLAASGQMIAEKQPTWTDDC